MVVLRTETEFLALPYFLLFLTHFLMYHTFNCSYFSPTILKMNLVLLKCENLSMSFSRFNTLKKSDFSIYL